MALGPPDLVDCERLAADAAVLQRVYELADLPRLQDVLAEPRGTLNASFAFAKLAGGRLGVLVTVTATPQLVCQRCLQGFGLPVTGGSEIAFATADEAAPGFSGPEDSEREFYRMENGQVSLRDLAEEEILLSLPLAPACSTPLTCGKATSYAAEETTGESGDMRRPFSVLQDLLKKT